MKRVLLVGPSPSLTFVAHDLDILSREYRVDTVWRDNHRPGWGTVLAVLWKLLGGNYDLLVIWFAEPYDAPWLVALARILRVHSILIVGGYEVTYIPEIDYGALRRSHNRVKLSQAIQGASVVLTTSQLLASEVRDLGRSEGLTVIPPGIDCELFSPGNAPRNDLVVTVASISERTVKLKGLDVFAEVSRSLPRTSFAILGPCDNEDVLRELREAGGDNLLIEGERLSAEQLADWYRRATVYAQLSARESFGVALAEAMACECRPVASDRGALPEVVGGTGTIVPYGDVPAAAEAIRSAVAKGSSESARRRVQRNFETSIRRQRLLEIVSRISS